MNVIVFCLFSTIKCPPQAQLDAVCEDLPQDDLWPEVDSVDPTRYNNNNNNDDDLLISKQNDSDGAMIELMHEHADIELKSKTSPHLVVREAIVVNDSDLETSTTPNNNCDVEQLDDDDQSSSTESLNLTTVR